MAIMIMEKFNVFVIYFKIYKYVKIQSNKRNVIIQIAMMEFGLGGSSVMIVIFNI